MARPARGEPIPENVGNLLKWEALDSWLTPTNNFFFVNHYGQPGGRDESTWRVGIAGLVAHPAKAALTSLPDLPLMLPGTNALLAKNERTNPNAVIANSYNLTAIVHNQENLGLEPVWPYSLIGVDGPLHVLESGHSCNGRIKQWQIGVLTRSRRHGLAWEKR